MPLRYAYRRLPHFALASRLLENKLDLLIEKPITASIEEADELIEKARIGNRILQVGHLERFNPAVAAIAPLPERSDVLRSAPA